MSEEDDVATGDMFEEPADFRPPPPPPSVHTVKRVCFVCSMATWFDLNAIK
jgi:hypothetical protein